ncbi:hypothetical protein cypCar_00022576 [Cyprinus carpio]|uniref:non-specific serine/threonine protein kinase n=1 Tax=Cyprinus carpio carpio TaxID=630221 RepID=A0A9J7ZZM3_CYPCA|nr:hypothetical protein cypCar_00022576 [Cyprinus carpio]
MRKMKGTCAFFQQTWRAVKCTVLYCYRGNKVDPEQFSFKPVAQQDQADPQPGPSGLGLELMTDPDPSGLKSELTAVPGAPSVEMTRTTDPADPEPFSVSCPSSLQLTPDNNPTSPDPLSVPPPSSLEPMAPQDLADPQPGASNLELTHHTDQVDSQPVNVSCQSNHELTPDSEPEPAPGPSGLHAALTPLPGPAAGSFFSLYDVGVSLGSGHFGTVYEGNRRSDGQKPGCIRPLLVEVALNLLVRESPKSPYIVQMYEWFEQHYRYVLILEYPHPCKTLLSFTLSNGGYLEETVARGLMRQVVLAAKHCLDRGVFHRDIKSDNILVNTETLQLKLIDFGCGKHFETSDYEEYTECPAVKATVKSLGVLLFRMVNGISFVDVQMIPSSTLSSECCDLLNQCKSSSLTLDKLLEHEWFRKS